MSNPVDRPTPQYQHHHTHSATSTSTARPRPQPRARARAREPAAATRTSASPPEWPTPWGPARPWWRWSRPSSRTGCPTPTIYGRPRRWRRWCARTVRGWVGGLELGGAGFGWLGGSTGLIGLIDRRPACEHHTPTTQPNPNQTRRHPRDHRHSGRGALRGARGIGAGGVGESGHEGGQVLPAGHPGRFVFNACLVFL